MGTLRRLAPLSCLAALPLAALGALDIGQKAPDLGPAAWLKGAAPERGADAPPSRRVVVFLGTQSAASRVAAADAAKLARPLAPRADERVVVVLAFADDPSAAVRTWLDGEKDRFTAPVAVLDAATGDHWRDGDTRVPHAVLVDLDGTVAWQGHPDGLKPVLARLATKTFDRDGAARAEALRKALEVALQGGTAPGETETAAFVRALDLTTQVLALDPLDVGTVSLRLGLARHLERRAVVESTLAALPVADLSAAQAEAMALECLSDPELRWREPAAALVLARRAAEAEPERPGAQRALGQALLATGRMEEALAAARRALALDPGDDGLKDEAEAMGRFVAAAAFAAGRPPAPDLPRAVLPGSLTPSGAAR